MGIFGFLSSSELLKSERRLNFGLVNKDYLWLFLKKNLKKFKKNNFWNQKADQQTALFWVYKYISLFGGDPSKVTIAGESAGLFVLFDFEIFYFLNLKIQNNSFLIGASSVVYHLLMPHSQGLFHKASKWFWEK